MFVLSLFFISLNSKDIPFFISFLNWCCLYWLQMCLRLHLICTLKLCVKYKSLFGENVKVSTFQILAFTLIITLLGMLNLLIYLLAFPEFSGHMPALLAIPFCFRSSYSKTVGTLCRWLVYEYFIQITPSCYLMWSEC